MSPDRPSKRAKQACEQCRRKKGKCSGDRPACSTCSRLNQPCFYYGEPLQPVLHHACDIRSSFGPHPATASLETANDARRWDERMVALESTVSQLVSNLHGSSSQRSPTATDASRNTLGVVRADVSRPASAFPVSASVATRIKQLSVAELGKLGELYLKHRDCQPLILFPPKNFVQSLEQRDGSVLAALLLIALRHTSCIGTFCHHGDAYALREMALESAMEDVFRGKVNLSTLQTLCLVLLHDFQDGNCSQSVPLLSLSTMLLSNLELHVRAQQASSTITEEARCCYWSVILLCRLLGHNSQAALGLETTVPYPKSCSTPPSSTIRPQFRHAYANSSGDNGIMVFVFEMAAEWTNVASYIRHFLNSGRDVSPWLTNSRYSTALAGVMSIETKLQPQLHRIKHIKFRDLTKDDLEACRQYWAPWLLSRFLYHTLVCLLNHPLLVILQLQGQKNDSELFRQQTSFYAAHHTRWLLYFIAFIEARDFLITDPTIGYCAAVVATIEMQLLYSVDAAKAQKKRRNIESCRRLIRKLVSTCPSMARTDAKLDHMDQMMSAAFAANVNKTLSLTVDLSRIRDVLDVLPNPARGLLDVAGTANPMDHVDDVVQSAQWTRLSRRPSVDQPDDGGSPASNQASDVVAMHHTHLPHAVPDPGAAPVSFSYDGPPGRPDPSEFPAEILFNSYGDDWWNAFECYDPDWPNF